MTAPSAFRPKAVEELIQEEQQSSLVLSFNKKDLFIQQLCSWYKKLSKKKKAELTKKKLTKRALHVAYKLSLAYESIPIDWKERMVREVGLVCYISQRALERRRNRQEWRYMESVGLLPRQEELESDDENGAKKSKRKHIVDLTDNDPPKEWIESKEAGKEPPRFLAIATDHKSNTLYWDYDTSHWKVGKEQEVDVSKLTRVTLNMDMNGWNSWEN